MVYKFECNVYFQLPGGGVDMTLSELQEMAARQQQQIESQQQILVAKEQRLKYLKVNFNVCKHLVCHLLEMSQES